MYKSASNLFLSLLKQMSTPKSKFVIAVLAKNYDNAKSLGLELYKKHPNYLLFYYFLTQSENKQLLLKIIKNLVSGRKTLEEKSKSSAASHIDMHLVVHLLKSDEFTYDDISFLEEHHEENSFIGLCIKKLFFLKKYKNLSLIKNKSNKPDIDKVDVKEIILKDAINNTTLVDRQNNSENTKNRNDLNNKQDNEMLLENISIEVNDLIERIDDFSLYQFAIDNGITIKQRESVNFLWYKLITSRSAEYAEKLASVTKNYTELSRILSIFPDTKVADENLNVLLSYLKSGYSKMLLQQAYYQYTKEQSFMNVKTLLALLIASREENYLVLALYLSIQASFEDNYEIRLISLFLSRYFLLVSNIKKIFSQLDVKNIQQHNLAFIWSDIMISKNIAMPELVTAFKKEISQEIAATECNLTELIDQGQIAIPFSLISLRDRLKSSVIVREIESLQIHSESETNMFSNLLGTQCAYLFSKLTVNQKVINQGSIETISSLPSKKYSREIFKNDLYSIVDSTFIAHFEHSAKLK